MGPYLFIYKKAGKWVPVPASTFRRELREIFKLHFGKDYKSNVHRAHGFRYGGIVDLGSIDVPKEWIRKISGHPIGSNVLDHYLKLKPETVAGLIQNRVNNYKKSNKKRSKR